MPIHHAVLALLAEGPSYGYELKSRFEESVGPQWGALNIGHLYQVLERLERDRLVTKRTVAQDVRPDRHVYRLTARGRGELEEWLATPFVRRAFRDDLFLKLMAASLLGREQLDALLRLQREAFLGELSALTELQRQHRSEPVVSLLIEAAIRHTRADLQLIEHAESGAAELASGEATVEAAEGEREAEAGGP